jgi:hypothetical protein
MSANFMHPSYFGRTRPLPSQPAEDDVAGPDVPDIDLSILDRADRSCCCSARPTVIAMMPPAPDREHAADLLLCAHHYRTARAGLAAAGARVAIRT